MSNNHPSNNNHFNNHPSNNNYSNNNYSNNNNDWFNNSVRKLLPFYDSKKNPSQMVEALRAYPSSIRDSDAVVNWLRYEPNRYLYLPILFDRLEEKKDDWKPNDELMDHLARDVLYETHGAYESLIDALEMGGNPQILLFVAIDAASDEEIPSDLRYEIMDLAMEYDLLYFLEREEPPVPNAVNALYRITTFQDSKHSRTYLHYLLIGSIWLNRYIETGRAAIIRQVAERLVEKGADLGLSDNDGNTPLHYLAQTLMERNQAGQEQEPEIETLFRHLVVHPTARLDLENNQGESVQHWIDTNVYLHGVVEQQGGRRMRKKVNKSKTKKTKKTKKANKKNKRKTNRKSK